MFLCFTIVLTVNSDRNAYRKTFEIESDDDASIYIDDEAVEVKAKGKKATKKDADKSKPAKKTAKKDTSKNVAETVASSTRGKKAVFKSAPEVDCEFCFCRVVRLLML